MAKAKSNYDVPAANKAIRLIEFLCESPNSLGVSDISKALGINKNMVFRLLHTLEKCDWVIRELEGTKYRIGLRPFHYASKPVSRMNLKTAAAEPLQELWSKTGESTYLGILDEDKVLYLDHLDATRNVKIAGVVGGRYDLHGSAPGKVLMAYADDDVLDNLLSKKLPQLTSHTITDPARLRKHLAQIRKDGFATDFQETADGGLCFAVPIYNYNNKVIGTVGVSVLMLHYTMDEVKEKLGPHIIKAGKKISIAMGYSQ